MRQTLRVAGDEVFRASTWSVLVVALSVIACLHEDDTRIISVDSLFWAAWRDPETFDSYLRSTTVDPQSSTCLRRYAEEAFAEEQRRLRECSAILTGSPAWNECHEQAEGAHDRGVVLSDIARAIDGQVTFASTEAARFLRLGKSIAGQAVWYQLADALRANVPRMECEVPGSVTPGVI